MIRWLLPLVFLGCGQMDPEDLNPSRRVCQCETGGHGVWLVEALVLEGLNGKPVVICPNVKAIPYHGCKLAYALKSSEVIGFNEFTEMAEEWEVSYE